MDTLWHMSLFLRRLRFGLIALAAFAVVLGVVDIFSGDSEDGVAQAVGGLTLVYVLWWLPRRSVRRDFPTR